MQNALSALPGVERTAACYPTAEYPLALDGVPADAAGLIGGCIAKKLDKTAIFVAPDEGAAGKIVDCLRGAFSEEDVAFLPAADLVFDAVDAAAADSRHARISVLRRAARGEIRFVVTTVDGIITRCPDPETLKNTELTLTVGKETPFDMLLSFLSENGYTRLDTVEGAGGYAVRGSIVDIFCPDHKEPVRIDFFGDTVDSMGFFDVEGQRRSRPLDSITIGPADVRRDRTDEAFFDRLTAAAKKLRGEKVKKTLAEETALMREGLPVTGADRYLPFQSERAFYLTDHMEDAVLFVFDHGMTASRFDFIEWQFEEDAKRMTLENRPFFPTQEYFLSREKLAVLYERKKAIFLSSLSLGGWAGRKLSSLCGLGARDGALTRVDPDTMIGEIRGAVKEGYKVFWCVGDMGGVYRKMLSDANIPFTVDKEGPGVILLPLSLKADVAFPDGKLLLIGERVEKQKAHRRIGVPKGKKIRSFSDIRPGDLVVHAHHGIGVYRGIRRVENHGVVKDYLTVSYDKGDMLYVPAPQLDLLTKYVGTAADGNVKLSRLGSPAWEKQKQKVRAQASVLAKELIELYAKRQNAPGFAFSPDTDWQRQFEDNFPYVETEDQIRSVQEIKEDMQRPVPMDRLLCGDVGFGKTEVALRAVFKAVTDSKQAAILAPTTILSDQHLATVRERFAGFPVRSEVLNRFKTKKEQDQILRRLRRGEIDIIIGTHRLLQKDVVFKDLGLLVVDEEQRFGVKHKEKIKEMSIGVDVLTLSATPIPRTLNMALSGIRDMSMIEEAPADRYPVATYVLEYDENVVMGAIRREMRRQGCVYYLKNDIEKLDGIAARIRKEVPTARIALAHGRMKGAELEKIWDAVWRREVDVLLCTTIIETGLDVPFTNTLIIEDADRMGLAQLHQIRGRIGRSSVRAYAYLTYRTGSAPSEVAAKRLATIREFTEFGSGFKIALRDLEIRGAGSVLGESQHGHINSVGYEMYMKILSDVIGEQKGIPETLHSDCAVDIPISAYISSDFVESEAHRIDLYKKIAAIENDEDLRDITDEIIDRFGEPPTATVNLMRIAKLRGMARRCGVDEIKSRGDSTLIYLRDGDPENIIKAVQHFGGRLLFSEGARPYLTLRHSRDLLTDLQQTVDFLSEDRKQ